MNANDTRIPDVLTNPEANEWAVRALDLEEERAELLADMAEIHAIISRGGPRDSGRRLSEIFQIVMRAQARVEGGGQ